MGLSGVCQRQLFLSTPSVRRATDGNTLARIVALISIHALRAEGDGAGGNWHPGYRISIHALRAEGDRRVPAS